MYLVYARSVKKFYRSVKIPDQVGDDLLIKLWMTAPSRHCRLDPCPVIAGLTGNLFILQRLHRIAP